LPRPLIVYIGGGSGTGKSSLALELAPLLQIYRLNATDTIRQVMRMVFTPAILPALHRSTFETSGPLGLPGLNEAAESDATPQERWIANFDEQARRVNVGVRAVVERAIAENMSVIVEGVHLSPGMVPFPDLEGAAYQVPLILGTLDREAHRARLLSRMPSGERNAARYITAFDSIRAIHDYLLDLAETNDVPLLDTFSDDRGPQRAMRLITGELERRVPALARANWMQAGGGAPALLIAIDGAADRPVRTLGGRSPLQAARTPNLDRLAAEGQVGLADPVAPGVVSDTAAGTLALFGQSPQALRRGPVEAIGAGLKLTPDDIALRANLATADKRGNVIDRRAGRIREEATELARALDRLPLPGDLDDAVTVRVSAGTEHRLAIVLHGKGLSPAITGSDPGDSAIPCPPLIPTPADLSSDASVFTARVLAAFEAEARKVLEHHPINKRRREADLPAANLLLTRGAGHAHRLVPLEEAGLPLRIACVSGDRTVLGLAKIVGAKLVTRPGMTANLDTDLGLKFRLAAKQLKSRDLVLLHVKGADIAAHDRRPDLKVRFIEQIDEEIGRLLAEHDKPMRIAVASDHATLSESGQHGADPVPVLIWGDNITADEVETFDEQSAAAGSLHRFPLQMLLGRLFELG
jgi:2,3-bisphosphoglycerate-independent phosphoglycerate mutase